MRGGAVLQLLFFAFLMLLLSHLSAAIFCSQCAPTNFTCLATCTPDPVCVMASARAVRPAARVTTRPPTSMIVVNVPEEVAQEELLVNPD